MLALILHLNDDNEYDNGLISLYDHVAHRILRILLEKEVVSKIFLVYPSLTHFGSPNAITSIPKCYV